MNQMKGTHCAPVRNRSSKHIYFLTSHCKSVYRSMSNEALNKMRHDVNAVKEINRRAKKHAKAAA